MPDVSLKTMLLVIGAIAANTQAVARTAAPEHSSGVVIDVPFTSTVLRDNLIGLSPERVFKVYLPPGYAKSTRRYPVVYFLHDAWSSPRQVFEDGRVPRLLDRGFANGVVREFIFVAADYSGPTTGSLYENSPVSGRWLDYTVDEVVPFIDRRFRTLPQRESRAVVGDFFGGRGTLKLAMTHAEVFGVAYALHPVATGTGDLPWTSTEVDWPRMYAAKNYAELAGLGRTQVFWALHQAFAPNPSNPPCYCDFYVELKDGKPSYNTDRALATKKAFLLDETVREAAPALRTLRGLAFDWGRFDSTQAHVASARQFSRLLEELGVEHEAEEYRGDPFSRTWTEDGRFAERVLPFLQKHLAGGS